MDAEEHDVYDYLAIYGDKWVNAKEVCRRAGGKRRFYEDNDWARPVLQRMKEQQIVESNIQGHYRLRPEPEEEGEGHLEAPDMEKILQEDGVPAKAEQPEPSSDDPDEQP